MEIIIAFLVGVLVGSVGWYFVHRNNKSRIDELEGIVKGGGKYGI